MVPVIDNSVTNAPALDMAITWLVRLFPTNPTYAPGEPDLHFWNLFCLGIGLGNFAYGLAIAARGGLGNFRELAKAGYGALWLSIVWCLLMFAADAWEAAHGLPRISWIGLIALPSLLLGGLGGIAFSMGYCLAGFELIEKAGPSVIKWVGKRFPRLLSFIKLKA